ncbi:MAG: BrnT family toxin [Candidatus Dormibacteraeota bacterium]|uniref:BrnT family toxin n=1 Tax=Candidatus Amunia macphersoniae TaxID=3127014 RepID=A0A934KD38_9BACT|nr:BrnT family toxin [Candidatus Dormibacteraeota bacterium]
MFDWDREDGNSLHIREHGVEPGEAEQAYLDPHRLGSDAYNLGPERRSGWIGATDAGRVLFLITVRRGGQVRIVTARDASPTMKRRRLHRAR